MSLLDSLRDYVAEMHRDRHPYLTLELKGLRREWVLKQGGNGCRPVKAQATIAMQKGPPTVSNSHLLEASAPTCSGEAVELTKEAKAFLQKYAEAAREAVAKQAAATATLEENCPQTPSFDMFDLPIGMEAMGFKYAAYFARKWFNGKANIIEDKQKDDASVIQPKEFVDKNTLTLNWVLKFGDVRVRYEHLLARGLNPSSTKYNIYNDRARMELKKNLQNLLAKYNNFYSGTLDTLTECGNDPQVLHQRFQFQHVKISVHDVLGGYSTVMNDLTASLANFDIYAAAAIIKISTNEYSRYNKNPWQYCSQSKVEITHIYVYAKDSYSFNDKQSISQYLGHWNRQGVVIAWDAEIAEKTSEYLSPKYKYELGNNPRLYLPSLPEHLDKPVDIKNSLLRADVFYPVRNRDFRRWRELKQHGGDFLIFSNMERIKLPQPIVLDLDEVCKDLKL